MGNLERDAVLLINGDQGSAPEGKKFELSGASIPEFRYNRLKLSVTEKKYDD